MLLYSYNLGFRVLISWYQILKTLTHSVRDYIIHWFRAYGRPPVGAFVLFGGKPHHLKSFVKFI